MSEPNIRERLNSEEGKKKAESLFSQKFREYLTNKNSFASNVADKTYSRNYDKKPSLAKDYSASSGETTASESSRKSGKKVRKKLKQRQSHWNFHYSFRNRLIQCSLLKSDEEVVPPDELKPLLMNMTILLQDLKQSPSEYENLYNLVSKITILVSEFIRRPLKKIQEDKKGEHSKNLEKIIDTMMILLEEYKNGPNLDSDNSIREYKRIKKEIVNKDSQISEAKKKLSDESQKNDLKVKDLNLRVRNSILVNEKLKSEIKFNQSRVKRYKKALLEKEWAKHKLEIELTHLKKKISRADLSDNENADKQPDSPESSLKNETFYKSILPKNKSIKSKKGKVIQK